MAPRRQREDLKSAGRYDTPPALASLVVGLGLDAALDEAARGADPAARLLALRVCDPTCGEGNLLVEAARRIAERVALARTPHPSPDDRAAAMRDVVRHCIHGVERDPGVAARCRRSLAHAAGLHPTSLRARVRTGDAVALVERWRDDLPDVAGRGGFDAVLANPPFLNAIERRAATADRARLRRMHPELGATADVAFHFLAIADALRRPGGRASVVLPRAALSAPSAARLRARLGPAVRALYAPGTARLFSDAHVAVCVVALGADGPCLVSRDDDPSRAQWREAAVEGDAWWRAITSPGGARDDPPGPRLGERFEVRASMTASEAYAIAVVDDRDGDGPALVTTGLIDRDRCRWGERACRYLGRTYAHPRLALTALPATVARRVERARRPKVVVAGLGRRVECFVDEGGAYVGAVSTWTITHPRDDVGALHALAARLHSPAVDARLGDELGATALGGGSVTVTRRFLDAVPLGEGWQASAAPPVRGG